MKCMTKSVRWLCMTRIEQYNERQRIIEMLHQIGVDCATERPDVAETCYRMTVRLNKQNDKLARVIANLEATSLGATTREPVDSGSPPA